MSIEEGIDEIDCYFEPIRQDANRRLLGIKEPEYKEEDYNAEDYDESDYSYEEAEDLAEEDEAPFETEQ